MPEYGFGSGALWSTASAANSTPVRYGALQNVGVDFKSTIKQLYGQNQLPLTVARGGMAINGKGELVQMQSRYFNDIFFGALSTATGGQILAVDGEAGSIPATPYAITVTNSATWTTDLGVTFSATGLPLTRVASGPTTKQYSVAAGVYTFAAADTLLGVKISYIWTTTGGETLTIANQPMGVAPTFATVLSLPYNSQKFTMTLNACVADGISVNTSLEDFTKLPFTFNAFTDSSSTLGTMSFAEAI